MNTNNIFAEVVTITPEMAEVMLTKNKVNRKPRKGRVDLYAKQMSAGQWRVTGETLVFGTNGQLLQGQHRLMACVQSGSSFRTVVVYGVDPESMRVMDSGAARTAGDAFSIEGTRNHTIVAAVCRYLIGVERGIQTNTAAMALITRDELFDFYEKHCDLVAESVPHGRRLYSELGISASSWTALAYVLLEADADMAVSFIEGAASGVGLYDNDPRLALRNFVTNVKTSRRNVPWWELMAVGIKAWNAFLEDKPMKMLKTHRSAHPWPEVLS